MSSRSEIKLLKQKLNLNENPSRFKNFYLEQTIKV